MTDAEKQVQQASLDAEKKILDELQKVYEQALKDCTASIEELASRSDLQNLQSIIYQQQYQEMLQQQLDNVLDNLQSNSYNSIEEYLTDCYTNGYTGAMYDIADQGIPVITPIKQNQVVKALQTDSKLSTSLYNSLGENVTYLKNSIRAELSRGIAGGSSWLDIAQHIATGMNSPWLSALARAMRIARTEGHRIQNEAALDAMQEAKDHGADIVKQWDATLDQRTRPAHQMADGQIRELDEPFDVGGEELDAPGIGGSAANVINCRCVVLQRAKWALTDEELKTLQDRADYFGLDKTDDFNTFKEKYLQATMNGDTMSTSEVSKFMSVLQSMGIPYNEAKQLVSALTEDEIIQRIGGGDCTKGSCSSLALSYIADRYGNLDVVDFRGGTSQVFFSQNGNINEIANLSGVKSSVVQVYNEQSETMKLLDSFVQPGKEYYLATGKHAAVIRKTDSGYEYLELQTESDNGFHPLTRSTLKERFGCTKSHSLYGYKLQTRVILIDAESLAGNSEFQEMMGYINTPVDQQKKGSGGYAK